MHPRKRPRKNASAMRLVGAVLAQFRTTAGLTQRALAERVGMDCETLASIEQGRRPLRHYAEILDRALTTKGALAVAVDNMPEIDLIPAWAEQYMDLEREALARLSSYENQVVPGLLQTESYIRAVFRSRVPILSEADIDSQTAARLERGAILHRAVPLSASFVIWEAVLRAPLGGREACAEQLRHWRLRRPCPGSPSNSCRSTSPHIPHLTGHSSCWKPRTINVSPTLNLSAGAN